MANPETLSDFVKLASGPLSQPKDRHYCLILWGHGTELLLDRDPGTTGERYLSPAKLKVRSGLNPYDPGWTPYLSKRYAVAPHRARS